MLGKSLLSVLTAICFLASINLHSEFTLDNWRNYSSLLDLHTAAIDHKGRIWAGSSGGVFMLDPTDGSYREFSNIDSLLSLQVSVIRSHPKAKLVFIGTEDGVIDILSKDFEFIHINDIKKSRFPTPRINDIVFRDSIAFVGGGFGLTIFHIYDKVFLQTPTKLGTFQPNTEVNNILIHNDKIWVATSSGIAYANINSQLINPEVWRNYNVFNGLPEEYTTNLCAIGDDIYFSTNRYICKIDGDTIQIIKSFPDYDKVKSLFNMTNDLVYTNLFQVADINDKIYYHVKDTALINTSISGIESGLPLIVLLKDKGLVYQKDNRFYSFIPNTPASNLFMDIAFNQFDNRLWVTTEDKFAGKGILIFENNRWTIYNSQNYSELVTNYYHRVTIGKQQQVILSGWGTGFVLADASTEPITFKRFDNENSPLLGITDNPSYIVTGEAAYDPKTDLYWILNWGKYSPGPILVSMNSNGEFTSHFNKFSPTNRTYMYLAIDNFGTKWLGSNENGGIYYLNEGSLGNPSDDIEGVLNQSNGLPSNMITSMAVDGNGWIWFGTPNGIGRILNPSAILRGANPIVQTIKSLGQKLVNDVMVDALNNIWVATNEGVFVLDPEETFPIGSYNTTNSPIIADDIISLATDFKTGKIYFGSRSGMSVATSFSILPEKEYLLDCYPQPFYPEFDEFLTIEGLARDSHIKILTTNGEHIKTINTSSRKAIWDGRDDFGNLVSSGIYLIIANSRTSDAGAVTKFSVIRK